MSITAHYIVEDHEHVKIRSRLIALRHIPGTHEGPAIGTHFLDILDKFNIAHKIGQITTDNASNNDTMLRHIEQVMTSRSIPFSPLDNRIRYVRFNWQWNYFLYLTSCFAHIINLIAQEFIDALVDTPAANGVNSVYLKIVQSNIVGRAKDTIVQCRISSVRRDEWKSIILDLQGAGKKVPLLALIYDVATRWSSTLHMIARLRLMREVCWNIHLLIVIFAKYALQVLQVFLGKPRNHNIIKNHDLTDVDFEVLADIQDVLEVFNRGQELLSSERTPTLCIALPAYETMFQILRKRIALNRYPHLHYAINRSLVKLEHYMELSRQNPCYGYSMLLNPKYKLAWMTTYWTAVEVMACVNKIKTAMLAYVKAERGVSGSSNSIQQNSSHRNDPFTRAASNLDAGLRHLEDMLNELVIEESGNQTAAEVVIDEDQDTIDNQKVDAEYASYVADALPQYTPTHAQLMHWWQQNRLQYPTLWKIARDILPAQATSVPSEQVFSSSKHITTQERSRIDTGMVEKLQILKFGLQQEKLDFLAAWVSRPEGMIGGLDYVDYQ
jgi:hypothetical protein